MTELQEFNDQATVTNDHLIPLLGLAAVALVAVQLFFRYKPKKPHPPAE